MKNLPLLASQLIEKTSDGIMITDKNGVLVYVNNAFTQISGFSSNEAVGVTPGYLLKSGKQDGAFYSYFWESIKKNGRWKGEVWNKRKNGEVFPESLNITAIVDTSSGEAYYVGVIHDLTSEVRVEAELKHKANHDVLTGLPNRNLFGDRLQQAVIRAKRQESKFAVLFVDMDNFKHINDSMGHIVGDALLKEVSKRLMSCARDVDTVSRVGGDEFTLILEEVDGEAGISIVAARILEKVCQPCLLEGKELQITISVGIATFPENGSTAAELVKNADMAMYHVKEMGRNNFYYFTPALNEKAQQRMETELSLRKAIRGKEVIAFFQPKVDMIGGQIIGMEALARWPKGDGKFASPAQFVPVAEQTGMILEMDILILEKTCNFMNLLAPTIKKNGTPFKVSVNLSAKNLERKDRLQSLVAVVERMGVDPKVIEFEVTESIIVRDVESALELLHSLTNGGYAISIDDFGTGYSSLSYLARFPLSTLKVDKTFVDNIESKSSSLAIVQAIISMAHGIGVKAIAEGVEKKSQLEILRKLGCDQLQGYIFSKPLPEKEIAELLKSGKRLTD
jgi:diguanylate cyclase (GGDEF)-like protein/PAS domain S-box-containing protein